MNRYRTFFAAFKSSQQRGNPITREEMVLEFTQGRTSSIRELTDNEILELTIRLNRSNASTMRQPPGGEKAERMRRGIIALFHKMGYEGRAAGAAAREWAYKQGVNGAKKPFNDYTTQELYQLLMIAEKMVANQQQAIRKRLRNEQL